MTLPYLSRYLGSFFSSSSTSNSIVIVDVLFSSIINKMIDTVINIAIPNGDKFNSSNVFPFYAISSCSIIGKMSFSFSSSYRNNRPFCVQVVCIRGFSLITIVLLSVYPFAIWRRYRIH